MKKRLWIFLLAVIVLFAVALPLKAISPYATWTLGPGGYLFRTQDAYTPLDEIEIPVSSPEDMYLAPNGSLYIADTGNGRIVQLDEQFQVIAEYGVDLLDEPTGIFVDENGTIYVADAGSNTVVIMDRNGTLINAFGRPDEPLYGEDRAFLPRKITVDARRNLYIVSEGSVNGLVMLNIDGDFIGYFGANSAEMSIKMILQRLFLTEEQLDQFIRNESPSPTNLAIDSQSLVYTITAGTERWKSIRKFTVSGRNLIDSVFGSNSFRDIHVSDDGLLAAVDSDGMIFEYDLDGTLLFAFGAPAAGDQRLGLMTNPTAIERVNENLYVLDKDKNAIVTFQVTDFARRVHDGVRLYTNGFYEEARPYFEEVLNYNGLVIMAYQALADADYNEEDYSNALLNYRYAEDRRGYSEAFWEMRNNVLQQYLGTALGVLVVGWVTMGVFTRLERRRHWLDPVRRALQSLRRVRLIDDFAFMFRFIRKPVDSFYYIKQKERGSLLFALLIYAWVLISRIVSIYLTGFVFNRFSTTWEIQVEMEIAFTVVPILLWVVANYLIATISDGEGSFKQVIIGSAYSLFPYALFALPIALFSNVLTLNEIFIYDFASQIVLFWCGVMLVIMVKELHNFSLSQTVRNLLGTLFTMAMFLLTTYILYVLFNQLIEFIMAIVQEVGLRG